jgi:hypothetical protein
VRAPLAAIPALVWAVVGAPLVVCVATRPRRGGIAVHVTLMSVSVVIEVGVGVGFSFRMGTKSPSRGPHGAARFQDPPRLRHRGARRNGEASTGIYNYVFLYVMTLP